VWRSWRVSLASLLLAIGLPVVGHSLRRSGLERCALDGVAVLPIFRARMVGVASHSRVFCCVHCAELWLEHAPNDAAEVIVTDEVSGREIDASLATFVRSQVMTVPTSGNRVHVFAERSAAEAHAASAHGRVLRGTDRPFAAFSNAIDSP
jgi:hypothetical protein